VLEVPFSIKLMSALEETGITVPDSVDPAALARTVTSIVQGRSSRILNTTTDTTTGTTTGTGNEKHAVNTGEEVGSAGEPALPSVLPPILTLEKASFSYPGQGNENQPGQATVHDVDLDVPEGAVTLLCGPNGSGKSTMLQMCNGLIRPDSGRVLFKGKELVTLKRQKGGIPGKVALLFQNPERQLFSDTVFDDVAFGPRNLGLAPEEVARRVSSSMEWVGLGKELVERPVYSLSGGQMRRVGIAGVLAMEAELLVLDEPTDGLDPVGVQEFYTQARKYCESTGTTILMAAHEIPEQITLVDHLCYMDGGKMMFSGPPGAALTGLHSCVPEAFLPDHLVIRQELERHGVAFSENDLSPDRVLARIKSFLADRK
jgi:energy-coupling factor transport system ATP-binding protein